MIPIFFMYDFLKLNIRKLSRCIYKSYDQEQLLLGKVVRDIVRVKFKVV